MRDKISAIIIDPGYKYRDYSKIKYDDGAKNSEKHFSLLILENGDGIMEKIYNFRGVDAIVTVGDKSCWGDLASAPFFIRKKWTHVDDFVPSVIVGNIIATFKMNLIRANCPTLFSFFTCTYNTGEEKLRRLFNSMLRQTYREWDWYIIDDSPTDETIKILESFKDPRITIIKNVSTHGNIGFNKHAIAMMCDGDFLCEVDHDDELTPDCLKTLLDAYNAFPESDFLYSCALELKGLSKTPIIYGDGWGWGEGLTKTDVVNGVKYTFSESPGINPYSIRTIYAQPNHIRCWKASFYHKICGHNPELSVLDDQEILIRTFLNGKMTKIGKALYIQYEGDGERGVSKDNTQSKRFGEIQRTTYLIKDIYDKKIHDRIVTLGKDDDAWNDSLKLSQLWKKHTPGQNIMSNLYEPKNGD